MAGGLLLAFLAGLVTILNPCVLPLVPIIVGSALGKSRAGPLALAGGLVASFTTFGFGAIAFGHALGIDEGAVRNLAGALLLAAGAVLLVPQAQAALAVAAAPIAGYGNRRLAQVSGEGWHGQAIVGLLLGLVWAPCVGPTLGVAIAAASQGDNLIASFIIFLAFGLGVATSILAFAYGSRRAMGERRNTLVAIARHGKPLFGAALVVVGAMVLSGFDKVLEAALLDMLPRSLVEFTTRF
jgi:cytochrome c biogenesis protein CcdA